VTALGHGHSTWKSEATLGLLGGPVMLIMNKCGLLQSNGWLLFPREGLHFSSCMHILFCLTDLLKSGGTRDFMVVKPELGFIQKQFHKPGFSHCLEKARDLYVTDAIS